jgi:hypothetical protein
VSNEIAELLLRSWEELCESRAGAVRRAVAGALAMKRFSGGVTKNLDARFSLDIAPKAKF